MGRIEARLYVPRAMEPRRGLATKISISFGETDIAPEDRVGVPKLLIPKIFMFGTQPNNAYEAKKRKRVELMLKNEGTVALIRHPATLCAIPFDSSLMIAIMDGHHRSRYSPEVAAVASLVYTPEQIVHVLRKKDPQLRVSIEDLVEDVCRSVDRALDTFINMPPEKFPHLVPDVRSVEELRQRFQEL